MYAKQFLLLQFVSIRPNFPNCCASLPFLLNSAELVERERKGVHRIVDKRGSRVQVPVRHHPQVPVHHALHNAVDHILHLRLVHVDHAEGGEVRAAVLEVVEVDGVRVEAGEEEVVALADEAHLLALLDHLLQDELLALQDDQVGLGLEDLLEDVPIAVLVVDQLLDDEAELVHGADSGGLGEDLLEGHEGVVVLVEDGDGLPGVGLQQVEVGRAQGGDVRVQVEGVLAGRTCIRKQGSSVLRCFVHVCFVQVTILKLDWRS